MADDMNLAPLALCTIYGPVFDALEITNGTVVNSLREKCEQIEKRQPGFLLEFLRVLIERAELDINLQECFLRLQGQVRAEDVSSPQSVQPQFQELSHRAASLRKILSRIPDEMNDRKVFLETIKEIASSIKKLLDATNNLFNFLQPSVHPALEQRKRDFVKYSKRFSNTLKDYFKGEQASLVYLSANQLIYQTYLIVKTVRDKAS